MASAPTIAAGRKAISTPKNETPRRRIVRTSRARSARCEKIDRQQREDRAELDQHREGLAEGLVVEAEEPLDEQQMAGRRYRNEFGQALDDAEDEALKRSNASMAPRAGGGNAQAAGWAQPRQGGMRLTGIITRGHGNGDDLREAHRPQYPAGPGAITCWPASMPVDFGGNCGRQRTPLDRRFAQRRMLTLFHHPFCPHSRFMRLALAKHG